MTDTFNIYTDSISGPKRYCGHGNFSTESNGKSIVITLVSAWNSSGGSFSCYLQSVEETDCKCGWKMPVRILLLLFFVCVSNRTIDTIVVRCF